MSTPNNTTHTDYQQNEATTISSDKSSNNKTAGGDDRVELSKNETSNFDKEEITFDEKN